MSTTIDQKVVEMRFDNQQFEKNIETSINTLEKLKQRLNLTGAARGIEEVGNAANKCDMSGLSGAVENVRMKFSALEVMGITALTNITNSAVNAGKRIVSALTIDPVKTGFNEYELKMGSIQTIMAATGESLESVNGYLNDLNEYSDRTIYSFSDMTQNIGKFTNAGVSLEDSVAAIKGISNVAAVSGANTNEASRAMYNFAQALSSGYVKLIDWKSIELANMGTVEFKEQLLESAVAAGTLTKAGDGMYKTLKGTTISATKGFNDSLQEQWMTTETLVGTLKKYTDETTDIGKKAYKSATEIKTLSQLYDVLKETAQSGWAQTWETIVGNFDEAKEFMSYLSDTIGTVISKTAEARNDMLENWKVLGGRTALLDSIKNLFTAIGSVVKPISEAFREIFSPVTAENLMGFTEGLKSLTERLIISDGTADKVKRTFKGLFAVLDIAKTIVSAMFKAVVSLLGPMGDLGGGVLDATASFGDLLVTFSEGIKTSGIFTKVFQGVADVIKAALGGFTSFIGFAKNKIAAPGLNGLRTVLNSLRDGMEGVGVIADVMKNLIISAFEGIGSFLESCSLFKVLEVVWKLMVTIGTGLAKIFGNVISKLSNAFATADFNGLIDIINNLIASGIILTIAKFLKDFTSSLKSTTDAVGGALGTLTGILDGVRGCLEAWQSKLKAEALMKIAIAVGILTAALMILASSDPEKLLTAVSIMALLFTELVVALTVLSSINTSSKFGAGKLVVLGKAMTSMAIAVLILAAAMKIISSMSIGELGVGLVGIAVGLTALVVAVNLLPETKVKKAAAAMRTMSLALLILAVAMKIMASMSWDEIARGLVATVVGLAALVAAINLLPQDTALRAIGMAALATAMVILAAALKIMSTMSWDEVARSLVALAGSMATLIIAMSLMQNGLPGAAAMLVIAPALILLAAALKIMATMSWDDVARGMVSLAGSMLILAGGLALMQNGIAGAAAMLIIAPALVILAAALRIMAVMSWDEVARSMVALGGSLLILSGGLALMQNCAGGIGALLLAAVALAVLAPVLVVLGSLSWESIAKGLVAIAGVLTIIGVAGALLGPVIPTILGLAAAVALMGIGFLAAGAGLLALGMGLSAIAVGFTALLASFSAASALAMRNMSTGIVTIVAAIVAGVGKGIIDICNVLIDAAPVIYKLLEVLLLGAINVLKTCIPPLLDCLALLLDKGLAFMLTYMPKIQLTWFKIILSLVNGIADILPDVIDAAANIIIAFIKGLTSYALKVADTGAQLIIDFINGMANSIRKNTPKMIAAVNNLMDAVMEAIGAWFVNSVTMGFRLISSVAKGITDGMSGLVQAGKDAIAGFIQGMKDKVGAAAEAAKSAGKSALNALKDALGINSPSKEFADAGRDSDRGLIVGLEALAGKVANTAKGVGEGALDSLKDAFSGVASATNLDLDYEPVIRPVMDLSKVESGVRTLGGMLNIGSDVGVLANVGAISAGMNHRTQNGSIDDVTKAIDKLGNKLDANTGNTYIIDGVTYDDGSNVATAMEEIVHAAKVERRT